MVVGKRIELGAEGVSGLGKGSIMKRRTGEDRLGRWTSHGTLTYAESNDASEIAPVGPNPDANSDADERVVTWARRELQDRRAFHVLGAQGPGCS